MIGSLLASKSCESPQFREKVVAFLSEELQAQVEIAPIVAGGVFYLETEELRIRAEDWACILRNVSVDLDPRSLISSQWTIRALQAQSAEAWFGHVPALPPPLADAPGTTTEDLSQAAQSLGLGVNPEPTGIKISSIKVSEFYAAIGEKRTDDSPLHIASQLRGSFDGETLDWEAREGEFRFQKHAAWQLQSLTGSADSEGVRLTKGIAAGPDDASIEVETINQGKTGQLLLAVEGKNLPVGGQYENQQDNPLHNLVVNASGQFHSRNLSFDDYLFTGRAELTGIDLGRLPIFQLFANQTGEDRFRGITATKATAEIEWEPGLLVMKQLKFEEEGLLRLNGQLQAMETGLQGSMELALPAVLAGRFPGGKPDGFSYPAGGWSRAMITVSGRASQWNEDLTERLLAQVSTDLPITPISLDKIKPAQSGSSAEDFTRPLTQDQRESYEQLFDDLLKVDANFR